MIKLKSTIALLTGRGVSFRVEYPNKLIMTASAKAREGIDLSAIKDNKHLFINSLPIGYTVTARQVSQAIDNYEGNVIDMKSQGLTGSYEAESKALLLMRDYILSMVS